MRSVLEVVGLLVLFGGFSVVISLLAYLLLPHKDDDNEEISEIHGDW